MGQFAADVLLQQFLEGVPGPVVLEARGLVDKGVNADAGEGGQQKLARVGDVLLLAGQDLWRRASR